MSFIKRLVEIMESQKKKLSKNKDFNVGLIYVLPFFCIKEKGSVSYEEADFCKKKIMRSGNFSTKAAI